MKINTKLLPIKFHYFFFMAAMGPILPQLSVYGRQLGVPPEIMGTVTGCLPILFLIAKPIFGIIVDIFRNYRKTIFITLICVMATSYCLICLIPSRKLKEFELNQAEICSINSCNMTAEDVCQIRTITCFDGNVKLNGEILINETDHMNQICVLSFNKEICNQDHKFYCIEDHKLSRNCVYKSWEFWYFICLMSIGTIAFNIINSISDAICFDVIGTEFDYGKQRVWGTVGFGITALIAGYIVNLLSGNEITYLPAFMVMLVCIIFDIISCSKLKLPIIPRPENFFKDMMSLLRNTQTVIFIVFAILAGVVDSIIIYFLFWYVEDLAQKTGTKNIKLLEGVIVASETLGSEIIFFTLAGKIIQRFGYAYTLSMGFMFYALRLALISFAPTPWWIVPIELTMQGPTYALIYTTIVAYANAIAPPGMSATMQGIAAGVDDGLGYAIGSVFGGLLYKYVGDAPTLQIFAAIALVCSIVNFILHRTVLSRRNHLNENIIYNSPNKAGSTLETAN